MKKILYSLIAKRVINEYAKDMGNYFDYIKGNEEDIFNEALEMVEKAPLINKIKMLVRGCA